MKYFTLVLLTFIQFASLQAKEPVTKGETDPVMLELDPYMIQALRSNKLNGRWGKKGSIVQLMQEAEFQQMVKKHQLELFNGPMLGHITSTSVKVWIRSAGPATFYVTAGGKRSKKISTTAATDFTGMATIEGLKPFTEYEYSVILKGKKIDKDYFRFKTAPKPGQAAKFSISFGSGARYHPLNEGI
ncbi:MAG: fibronectin type III domain-containing protein, partial [Lentisphaeraceae bacterium]|nr:fibronectin type III domain-containing protein [Lentisphaeraceae bacterium]